MIGSSGKFSVPGSQFSGNAGGLAVFLKLKTENLYVRSWN
jgi:hypothetical protein